MDETLSSSPPDNGPYDVRSIDEATKNKIFKNLTLAVEPNAFKYQERLPLRDAFVFNPTRESRAIEELSRKMKWAELGQYKHLRGLVVFDKENKSRFIVIWPYHYAKHEHIKNLVAQALGENLTFSSLTYMPEKSTLSTTADFEPQEYTKMYNDINTFTSPAAAPLEVSTSRSSPK